MRFKVVAICLLGAFALIGGYVFTDWYSVIPESSPATFVGRDSCVKCHQTEVDRFHGSHHDKAMDIASEETVLASFSGETFTSFGIESRFYRDDGRFMVRTEGPNGTIEDFEVKYVFGVEPLQQYMVEFDRPADMPKNEIARLQVLSICWDTKKKKWFQLQPPDVKEKIEPGDPLHWTGRTQCWNTSCADCHSTDLKKNFDLDSLTYHTTFSEIDVSCEACHGPGSHHVKMAESNSLFWDRKQGYGLAKLKGEDSTNQIETCAKCHARRGGIQEGFCGGKSFTDYYSPELLTEQTYHDDGQIKDEVYVYGSFLQSKMYHEGIRCTDCHDPHSTKVKFDTNELCTSCHAHPAGKYDSPNHHRHQAGSTGSKCVECHMPSTTYMHVDPRRDHSLRIPRPDLSVKHNTPNACSQCHIDSTKLPPTEQKLLAGKQYLDWLTLSKKNKVIADELKRLDTWAEKSVTDWYDEPKRPDHHAEIFHRIRNNDDDSDAYDKLRRMVSDRKTADIVRATAAMELSRNARELERSASRAFMGSDKDNMSPTMKMLQQEESVLVIQGLLQTLEIEIATILNSSWKANSEGAVANALTNYVLTLKKLSEHPALLVRIEASRIMLRIPSSIQEKHLDSKEMEVVQAAFDELVSSVKSNQERARTLLALGSIYQLKSEANEQQRRRFSAKKLVESDRYFELARQAYRDAVRVEPLESGARGNLAAMNEQLIGRFGQQLAELSDQTESPVFKKLTTQIAALREETRELRKGELNVLRVEAKRAIQSQIGAAVVDRYAMALYVDNQIEECEKQLKIAVGLAPEDPTIILHYVLILQKQKKFAGALLYADKLLILAPNDPSYRQLRDEIAKEVR